MVGVGIDEDTSALLNAENVIEVILAHGMVTIIDFSHLKHSSLHNVSNNAPISLVDIRMYMLLEDQKFDLNTCLVEF